MIQIFGQFGLFSLSFVSLQNRRCLLIRNTSEMQIVDEIEKSVHYLAEKAIEIFIGFATTEKLWYALLG